MSGSRIAGAEAVGTFILILGGPGTAILATGRFFPGGSVGVLGVALAFGFSLLVAAYAVGAISGCHINPAVTFGAWLAGTIRTGLVPYYVAGQLVGGLLAALVLFIVVNTIAGFEVNVDTFAVNGWGDLSPGGFGFGAMALVEIVMTAVLVFSVLSTTRLGYPAPAIGLQVGITLSLIHLVSIPVDNTSVNPVRSLSVAVFAGGSALTQLWAFIVFPLIGAIVGWLVHSLLHEHGRTAVASRASTD